MRRTRLVGITKTSQVSLLGSSDQRKLNNIRRITKSDPSLAKVFAEPVLDANGETISWYTDLPGSISPYEELSSSDKRFLETTWEAVCEKLKALREGLDAADRVILDNVVETPGSEALYLVGHELLVTDWSSVRVGYRPKNKNIGLDLNPEPVVHDSRSTDENFDEVSDPKLTDATPDAPKVESPPYPEALTDGVDEHTQAASDPSTDRPIEKPRTGFFYSLWFWGALFVFLCFLNWFLLIDACGVEGVQFLNFCR